MTHANTVELNYQVYGTGKTPLVMAHGLYGSSSNWRSIARMLGDEYTLYCPDARNHGGSPHTEAMDYPLMAADLARFIDEQCGGRAHVLGHSMGGKTAMQLALTQPMKIDKLIVVDIAPVDYDHSHRPMIEHLMKLDLTAIKNRAEADRLLAVDIPEAPVRLFLLQNLVRNDDGGFEWRMNLETLHRASTLIVDFPEMGDACFDGEAFFVYGSESDYVTPLNQPVIFQHFSQAELFEIPGAGHWVHADEPQILVREILRFLQG